MVTRHVSRYTCVSDPTLESLVLLLLSLYNRAINLFIILLRANDPQLKVYPDKNFGIQQLALSDHFDNTWVARINIGLQHTTLDLEDDT